MEVKYVDLFGKSRDLYPEEESFVLPYSGSIQLSNIKPNSCIINHIVQQHDTNLGIPIQQENISFTIENFSYKIVILSGELSQESVLDYLDVYSQYKEKYTQDGCLDYNALKMAFNVENRDSIKLCSFNKKISKLFSLNQREEILKKVKDFPHIFYKPKMHLKQIEEVRPASLVTRIGTDSIRHLASHSEHWKGIKANGLIPERLLAKILEDEYAIYENIVAKTLVDKLYCLEKKQKVDVIDALMNLNVSGSYSLAEERPAFFKAIHFLLKGFEKNISSIEVQCEEEKDIIDSILKELSKCKLSSLYRNIKKEKEIEGTLKKTNIFMMDNYYKKVYELWNLIGKKGEILDIPKKKIQTEYMVYTELVLLFSLQYMGFEPEDDNEIILSDGLFNDYTLFFLDWKIVLNTVKAKFFDVFITIDISQRKEIIVPFNIKLPDNPIYKEYDVRKDGGTLVFKRKLEDREIQNLANSLSDNIEKNQQQNWKNEFKRNLTDEMRKISYKTEKILFIPWKYGIPDDVKMFNEILKQLSELIPSGYDECYILNPTRPNELSSVTDEKVLKFLDSYNFRNQESERKNEYDIIPITLNDINSFRRIAKILHKNMILVKDEQNYCPQCGMQLIGNKEKGFLCYNPVCKFEIYNTQCPTCRKKYWYTKYPFPKTIHFDTESIGMKILLAENELGFKNITEFSVEEKPLCPYCTSSEPLLFKGTLTLNDYCPSIIMKPKKVINPTKIINIGKKHEISKNNMENVSKKFEQPREQKREDSVYAPIKQTIKCPYCSNYNKDIDKSLLYHLTKYHGQQASRIDNYIVFSKNRVLCPKCQTNISNCSDKELIRHLNKKCISFAEKKEWINTIAKTVLVKDEEQITVKIFELDKVYCPCCGQVLEEDYYTHHLKSHISSQSNKILSKHLGKVNVVLCPWCSEKFKRTESSVFFQHIKEFHVSEYKTSFTIKNGVHYCKICNTMLAGVHPAIIIQHLLGGCK